MSLRLLVLFLIFSSAKALCQTDTVDCYDMLETTGNVTVPVKKYLPRNAVVFVEGRKYTYRALVIGTQGDTLSDSKLWLISTNKRWKDDPGKQMEALFIMERFPGDSAALHSLSGNPSCCKWLDTVVCGIIENSMNTWIHPFRYNQFQMAEIAPFPDIMKPLGAIPSWKRTVSISPGAWGSWENAAVISEYKISDRQVYSLMNVPLSCWHVTAEASSKAGRNAADFLFHENYGFVRMHYFFENGLRYEMNMILAD